MSRGRECFMNIAAYLLWALVLSLGYALCICVVQNSLLEIKEISVTRYYLEGWLLLFPLLAAGVGVKKIHCFSAFFLLAVGMTCVSYFWVGGVFFAGVTAVLFVLHGANRVQQQLQLLEEELPQPSMFEQPSMVLIALPMLYYFIAGVSGQVQLQKMAIYHLVLVSLLFFVYQGIARVEQYIRLSETSANVPKRRILDTSTFVFFLSALLIALIVMPVIKQQYQYQPISFSFWLYTQPPQEIVQQESTEGISIEKWVETVGEGGASETLIAFWQMLEPLLYIAACAGGAYLLARMIAVMIVNFNKVQIEHDDKITFTFQKEENEHTETYQPKWNEWFDFSVQMRVRKRYKRIFQQYHPKTWQTPTEIEQMAQKNLPELHQLYEKVRYDPQEG